MLYDLTNPSDAYTFIAADREIAMLVVGCFGTKYGATLVGASNRDQDIPLMLFGGADEFCQREFGLSWGDLGKRLLERADAVADAFESFCCGSRNGFDVLSLDERVAHNAEHSGSLNDIGGRAFRFAWGLRERTLEVVQ